LADLSNKSHFHDFTVRIETNWRIDGKFDDVELNYMEEEKADKKPTIIKFQSKKRQRSERNNKNANKINFHTFFYDEDFAFHQFFSTFLEKFALADREEVFSNFVLVTNIPIEVPMKDSSIKFEEYHDQDFILNRLKGTKSYQIARTDGNIGFLKRYLLTMEFVKCVFQKTRSKKPSRFERIFSDIFESEKNILLQKVTIINGDQKLERWNVFDKQMFKSCATYLRKPGSQYSDIPKHQKKRQSTIFFNEVGKKLNDIVENFGAISGAQNEPTSSQKLSEWITKFLNKFIITTELTPDYIDDYFEETRNYLAVSDSLKKHFEQHKNICTKESYRRLSSPSVSKSHDKVVKKELSMESQEILGEEKPKKDEKVFTGSSENQNPSKSDLMAPKSVQSTPCNFKMELDLDSLIASFSRITLLEKMVADLQETVAVLTEKVSLLEENSKDKELILGGIPEKENKKV
jgi:hypothetical protein